LGLLANMQEVKFSKMNDERLCPVKFHLPGGWLLVMPRCKIITEKVFLNLDITKFWPNSKGNHLLDNSDKTN